ncbi:hypothetical protein BK648_20550 [Pseudomonas poae]|uniref:Uncharacterized protein n=1 Tax=Pseudomonas poae TaxID=200451 RepID=A0A423ETI9_9PSED|nr:hypothetical protein BK648_20550 [Pseudomonas poae]
MDNQIKLITRKTFKRVAVDSVDETGRLTSPRQEFRISRVGNLRIMLCFISEVVGVDNRIDRVSVLLVDTHFGTRCGLI